MKKMKKTLLKKKGFRVLPSDISNVSQKGVYYLYD